MGKAIQSLGHWSLKLFSLPQYAGLSSAAHLSLQHTPALTLPAESQSVYLQTHNTLSTTAPTAQSRKCYQRQCMSGWLRSATLRVEQTAPYLSVCTVSRVTTTCPVIRKMYSVCVSSWRFIAFRLSNFDDTAVAAIKLAEQSRRNSRTYFLSFFARLSKWTNLITDMPQSPLCPIVRQVGEPVLHVYLSLRLY